MIMNQTPYPLSFEQQTSQALVCRYGEEMRQYVFKPDIDVSGLSCLLQIAKTDGTFTENGVEVHTDPDTGECTLVITIPQQATVVKGLNRYSICVYGEIEGEDHLLYSAEGPLWVDDNLITDDMIQSVAEVNGVVFPQDFLTVENLVDIVNYVAAEIIKDDTTSDSTTWSSEKIEQEISGAAPIITGTAEGNPIIITDAANAPMYRCTVEIDAEQDLHGYDKPWPPGGGKNKLPMILSDIKAANTAGTWIGDVYTLNGVTFTINTDSGGNITSINVNGTASANSNLDLTEESYHTLDYYGIPTSGIFYFSGCPAGGTTATYVLQMRSGNAPNINNTGGVVPFTSDATSTYYFRINISSGTVVNNLTFFPLISNVINDTFAPYSNICPISGLSSVNVNIASSGIDTLETFSADLEETIYGGSADLIRGEKTKTWGYIASYNGESLPGRWMSDRDEYVSGTNPTTGAEVVFELAGPLSSSIIKTLIRTLIENNYITTNGTTLSLEYVKRTYDPVVYHGVQYSTNEQIVGKWVDGKDIYEKTFILGSEITLTANQWNSITGVTLSSVETPINAEIRNSRGITVANIDFLDSPVSVWGQNGNEKVKSITFRYTKS